MVQLSAISKPTVVAYCYVIFSLFLITDSYAGDRLLIERNARPLLAEGTLEALDPWETPLDGFFTRTHHNSIPTAMGDTWAISFAGMLKKPQTISIHALKKYPSVSIHAVLECSGNGRGFFSPPVSGIQWQKGAVGNAEWTGVPLAEVLKNLGVSADAVYATVEGMDEPVFKSESKFVRSIPLKLLLETNAMLAWQMNRVPIPVIHGGPVRLVIPGIYGQNWIKWVNKISFTKEMDHRLYAKKAYRIPDHLVKPGEVWDPVKQGKPIEYILVQSIITSPQPNSIIAPGVLNVMGKAFLGHGPIKQVDVSLDAGQTWQRAILSAPIDHAWQEFKYQIAVEDGKDYEVWARATDANGSVQPLQQEWNPKGYLYNAVDRVRIHTSKAGAETALVESLMLQHCQTCHSLEMVDQQRLDKSEWINTIKKMSEFGLNLSDADTDKISDYLAQRSPKDLPGVASRRVELNADTSTLTPTFATHGTSSKRGGELFAAYCQGCHGAKADGMVGPRLQGRRVSDAAFWSTVSHGKRVMPAFKDRLTVRQLSDIRAWLNSKKL